VEVESDGSEEMKPVSNEMEESFHSGADGSGEGQETWDDEKGKKKGKNDDEACPPAVCWNSLMTAVTNSCVVCLFPTKGDDSDSDLD